MKVIVALLVFIPTIYGIVNVSSGRLRGYLGGLAILIFLLGVQKYLVDHANAQAGGGLQPSNKRKFFDFIVTSEDNSYSLSRLQIYIWTVWVVVIFVLVAFATFTLPSVPPNLAVLMGINGFTAALSTAISDPDKLAGKKETPPNFVSDLFFDSAGTLDLPRAQMFVWTVVILVTHAVIFLKGYQCVDFGNPDIVRKIIPDIIPDINPGLLILMGVSNGGYLAIKAAKDKLGAGDGAK